MSEIYRTGVMDHLVRVLIENYESVWHPMVDTMCERSDNAADSEAYCTYCKKVVAIDSDHRCLECKWPIDERGDLGASPVDQDTVALSAKNPNAALIWWFAILAIPLGSCGLIFWGIKPLMWLPTPLRFAPYTTAAGSLIMLIYQSLNQPRVKFSLRSVALTGLLSGVISIIVLLFILLILPGGVVH